MVAAGCTTAAVTLVMPEGLGDWRTVAASALPVSVTWTVMSAYLIAKARTASRDAKDLSAQLARREIELGRTSTVDELTGLATRREFDAMVRLEFGRFQRHHQPTSLLMLELDDIGELGEAVGPLTKGLAVAELASTLKQSLRTIDIGGRFTETTIAVLLLETSADQARTVTDRIRNAVRNQTFVAHRRDGKFQLTISQGLSSLDASMKSHLEFVRAAEQALADARKAGYDQIVVRPAA